jgi:heme A synthase
MLQPSAKTIRNQRLLIGIAIGSYSLAVIGGVTPALGATLLSAVALAALGIALFAYVAMRVGPVAAQRLGARAQAAQRRYRTFAFVALAIVYVTLVVGALVTYQGALWSCLTLPLCATPNDLATLAMAHRVMAALAALARP